MTTIYEFELPKGYVDANGTIHKRGKMRLATAGDEISAARDPRVLSNPAYLAIVVLSKVIVEIAGVEIISTPLLEQRYTCSTQQILPICRICTSGSMTWRSRLCSASARSAGTDLRPL